MRSRNIGGLSDFGQSVVARMNELGVLIDVSHAAKSSMMQAAARSLTPVVATHSCMKALCDHKRNLDDEQLDMLAATGGLAQITIVSNFLRPKARAAGFDRWRRSRPCGLRGQAHGDRPCRHRHGFRRRRRRARLHERLTGPNLTAALAKRGYGREELEKIWGGNFLRLMRKAEEVAAERKAAAD